MEKSHDQQYIGIEANWRRNVDTRDVRKDEEGRRRTSEKERGREAWWLEEAAQRGDVDLVRPVPVNAPVVG